MIYSKQREIIYNAMKDNRSHPTADELYNQLKPKNPQLSIGTVYRNLNLLVEKGLIDRIKVPNGPDRFDRKDSPHYHMICKVCGKAFDIPKSYIEINKNALNKDDIALVEELNVICYGKCRDCI
ncbi:MAG: transcriptional repressor [Eubacteriales bacterium]